MFIYPTLTLITPVNIFHKKQYDYLIRYILQNGYIDHLLLMISLPLIHKIAIATVKLSRATIVCITESEE